MKKVYFLLIFCLLRSFFSYTQVVNYQSLYTDASFDNRGINTTLPVGSTPGSPGVTSVAGATYSIPLIVPKGTNGIAPSLSLEYNSMSGDGVAGRGWNLAGLSVISRVGQNNYYDDKTTAVELASTDRYVIDGQRLILKSGSYGGNGSTYGTEVDNFAAVTSYISETIGPTRFEVLTKDGVRMEYGNTPDSRILNSVNDNALLWEVNKITYPDNNYMEFKYVSKYIPQIAEIRYTGNTGVAPSYKIRFEYADRIDVNIGFEAGVSNLATSSLLTKVIITDESSGASQVVKTYELVYGNDNVNSYLKEFREFGSDGSMLNATIFKYGNSTQQFSFAGTPGYDNPSATTYTGDFNGDGLTDFVEARKEGDKYLVTVYTKHLPYSSQPNDFFVASVTDFPLTYTVVKKKEIPNSYSFMAYDFTGDGADDVLMVNVAGTGTNRTLTNLILNKTVQNYSYYTTGLGTAIELDPITIPAYSGYSKIHPSGNFVFTGDYDGDGVQDILTMLGNAGNSYYAHLYFGNKSAGFGTVGSSSPAFFGIAAWAASDLVHVLDFNGDGRSDIMLIKDSDCEIFTFDGYTAKRIHYSNNIFTKNHLCHFGDFNGDGKTDILARNNVNNEWKIYVSNGQTFYVMSFAFPFNPDLTPYWGDSQLAVCDLNGDGKSDIYLARDIVGSDQGYFHVYYNRGYRFGAGTDMFFHSQFTHTINLGSPPNMIGDFNGDGRSDVINFRSISDPMDVLYFGKDGKELLLEKVKNGLNHTVSWDYKKLTGADGFYKRGNLEAYPLNRIQPAFFAVSSFKRENGIGGLAVTDYTYEGARFHRGGKGFLGFTRVIATDLAMGLRTITENEFNTIYYTTFPKKTSVYLTAQNSLISETTHSYEFVSLPSKRFWVKTTGISEVNSLKGTTVTTVNAYDAYGNVTDATVNVNGVHTTRTETVYGAYPAGINNKPTSVKATNTRQGETPHVVTTTYGYNSQGQLTSKTDFSGLPKSVTTTYGYNSLGNLTSTTVTPSGMTARTISAVYDSRGRYAESTTNELNQTTTATFDSKWGLPLTRTGVDGRTTSFEYDGFGRLKKTNFPEGYSSEESYGWGNDHVKRYYHQVSTPGNPIVKTFYDVLDRETGTESEAFGGGVVYQNQTYDGKGNLISATQPFKTGESYITTTRIYDDYNRLITELQDALGTTSVSYQYSGGNTKVTTSAPSGTTSQTTDASGELIEAVDNGGVLTYSYYSHGGLKTVKNGTITLISNEYDAYGSQTKLTDANAGITEYRYNALGQLEWQKNAKGQEHTMLYNLIGQVTSRSGPEGTTTYSYGVTNSGGENRNKIKTVTGFDGSTTSYTYDSHGRLTQLKESKDGDHTTSYGYNSYGDLTSTTYPSSLVVTREYDSKGYLTKIKTGSTELYVTNAVNGQGQVTQYSKGGRASGVDYINGFPVKYKTNGIQELNLTWDYQKGNLASRNDVLKGKTESFTYDNLQRLTGAAISGGTAFTATYASNGNISTKTDAGTYSYGLPQFNAVSGVTNPPPSPIPTLQQDLTYTAFMKTQTVAENNYLLSYTYGADYERIKSELKQGGNTINTRYYFSGYEKDITGGITRYIQYISAPSGLAAIIESQGSSHTIHYTYTDHLGAILTVTNSGGTIEAEQSFDAWGRRRNPSTWVLLAPTAATGLPVWLYRGYTGHEHLDKFGLINMNGRMYDPVLGRMLSPDNYVVNATFTQDYNRYSYARNNPLVYTDPDGEFLFSALVYAGYFVQGILNGKSNVFKYAYDRVSYATKSLNNGLSFSIYKSGNTSITAGINFFQMGISVSAHHTSGNVTTSAGGGVGFMSGWFFNAGISYSTGDLNIGAGVGGGNNYFGYGGSITYDGYGLGYYQTQYGSAIGPDGISNKQVVGGAQAFWPGGSFRIENDFLAFQEKDRWRSNALELSIGNVSIGTRLYNNDPAAEGKGRDLGSGVLSLSGKPNNPPYGKWVNGQTYESPAWIGIRFGNNIDRVGYSHKRIHDATQNWTHREGFLGIFPFGHQNYYLNYEQFKTGWFGSSGYYNPYSLWGR